MIGNIHGESWARELRLSSIGRTDEDQVFYNAIGIAEGKTEIGRTCAPCQIIMREAA